MKKIVSLMLVLCMLITTICGCDNNTSKKNENNEPSINSATQEGNITSSDTEDETLEDDNMTAENENINSEVSVPQNTIKPKPNNNSTNLGNTSNKTETQVVKAEFDVSLYDMSDIEQKTKALKDYLNAIYGKYTLAGQTVVYNTEMEAIFLYSETGRLPAVRCFDFGRPAYDIKDDEIVSAALDWHASHNGIVHVMWHWFMPLDINDYSKGNGRWLKDFANSNFNPENTIIEGTREYEIAMEQIDNMAGQLRRLEVAGVPVLFRPLHEAGLTGTWWWGVSRRQYLGLWNMIYDRLMNHHKLKNLIWIWNGQKGDYIPPENTFDIASWDNYSNDGMATEYLDLLEDWCPGKMLAITENAYIPPASELAKTDRKVLFWNTWYGDFLYKGDSGRYTSGNYSTLEQYKENYNSRYVITLDELPNFIPEEEIDLPQSIKTYIDTGYIPGAATDWADDGTLKLEWETSMYQDCELRSNAECSGGQALLFKGYHQKVSECFLPLSVEEAGVYELEIRYYVDASGTFKDNKMIVNGVEQPLLRYNITGKWETMKTEISLKQGTNYFGFSYRVHSNGYLTLDYALLKKK